MPIYYKSQNKALAQKLRRDMTRQERRLWYDFLRYLPIQVRRQKQFGAYIVDFYIAKAGLVIELDGSGHYSDEAKDYDTKRDEYLNSQGLRVIRFSNLDVDMRFESVCGAIAKEAGVRME